MALLAPVQHLHFTHAELHVELGALVLSQSAQHPTLPHAARASHLLVQAPVVLVLKAPSLVK